MPPSHPPSAGAYRTCTSPKSQRYRYVIFEISSINTGGGSDFFAVYAGSIRVAQPPDVSFKPHKIGYSSASVNKKGDSLSYGLTILNNNDYYVDDLVFAMDVPPGTVLTGATYDPKVRRQNRGVEMRVNVWGERSHRSCQGVWSLCLSLPPMINPNPNKRSWPAARAWTAAS